eukprot:6472185-Amphidinium_carterae.1
MADLIAGEMLQLDGGSFRRAAAAKDKTVTLQCLAQHVGFTAVLRKSGPDCADVNAAIRTSLLACAWPDLRWTRLPGCGSLRCTWNPPLAGHRSSEWPWAPFAIALPLSLTCRAVAPGMPSPRGR